MKKLMLWAFVFILTIAAALAIPYCKPTIEKIDIPCQLVSSWDYVGACSSYIAVVTNSSGNNIVNFTFQDYGTTGLCYFNFNLTMIGSYSYAVSNGDTGQIIVGNDNMQLGITLGLGIVIAMFLFLAFKLDDSHMPMKIFLIIMSMVLVILIPATFIIQDTSKTFYKVLLGFVIIFWLYVSGYILYFILKKSSEMIPRR